MEKPMKFFFFYLFLTTTLFSDQLILDNETSFQKVAVEWAPSARVVQESNESLMQGNNPSNIYYLTSTKSKITIPTNMIYFRVLVWQTKGKLPDLLTNWIEIVPEKAYLVQDEDLTPILLMNGMGC
jgi:hypothetical protein